MFPIGSASAARGRVSCWSNHPQGYTVSNQPKHFPYPWINSASQWRQEFPPAESLEETLTLPDHQTGSFKGRRENCALDKPYQRAKIGWGGQNIQRDHCQRAWHEVLWKPEETRGSGGHGLQGHIIHVGINCHFFLQKTNKTETLAVHCESRAGEYCAPLISLENSEKVKNKTK